MQKNNSTVHYAAAEINSGQEESVVSSVPASGIFIKRKTTSLLQVQN